MSGDVERMTVTERRMLDALTCRYATKVTNGQWVGQKFLRAEHVPLGLRLARHRICDFVATSMHSTPYAGSHRSAFPPIYHGHEVKVSRSDWLAELRDPGKAEAFNQYMHYWWLVATADVVKDDLPEDWGLLVIQPNGRLRKVVDAPLTTPEPMPESLHGALLRAAVTTEVRIATIAAHRGDAMTITERITARLDAMEARERHLASLNNDQLEISSYQTKSGRLRSEPLTVGVHDPAAVLGLVDGLRKVVALHVPVECENYRCGNGGLHCAECDPHDGGPDLWPCPTLTALAAALDPVGEGSEGAEAAVEGPGADSGAGVGSSATDDATGPQNGCKDARETR